MSVKFYMFSLMMTFCLDTLDGLEKTFQYSMQEQCLNDLYTSDS